MSGVSCFAVCRIFISGLGKSISSLEEKNLLSVTFGQVCELSFTAALGVVGVLSSMMFRREFETGSMLFKLLQSLTGVSLSTIFYYIRKLFLK